jgi:hypothetical protein
MNHWIPLCEFQEQNNSQNPSQNGAELIFLNLPDLPRPTNDPFLCSIFYPASFWAMSNSTQKGRNITQKGRKITQKGRKSVESGSKSPKNETHVCCLQLHSLLTKYHPLTPPGGYTRAKTRVLVKKHVVLCKITQKCRKRVRK